MKFLFVLRLSFKRLFSSLKSTLVIILALIISVVVLLLLTEPILELADSWSLIQEEKRTWQVSSGIDLDEVTHEGSAGLYNELLWGDEPAEISDVNNVTVSLKEQNQTDDYSLAGAVINVYTQGNERYQQEIELIDGRFFSDEEMDSGENVIILTMDLRYETGDQFEINGISYEVIGLADNSNGTSRAWITESNALLQENYIIEIFSVLFSEPLSSSEEEEFENMVYSAVGGTPVNYYAERMMEFGLDLLGYIFLIALILLCAFCIVSELFRFMVFSRKYEFSVYKILGINRPLMAGVFFAPIFFMDIAGCGLGYAVYLAAFPFWDFIGMEGSVPAAVTGLVFLCIFIISFFTVLPGFIKLKTRQASEE